MLAWQKRQAWVENQGNIQRQSQAATVHCLLAKLTLGVTFCKVAVNSGDPRKHWGPLGNARNVVHDVEHQMWKLPMQHSQRNEMVAQKELLKFKLDELNRYR